MFNIPTWHLYSENGIIHSNLIQLTYDQLYSRQQGNPCLQILKRLRIDCDYPFCMFPHPFTIYYLNPMILFLTTFFANSRLEELLSTNDTLGAMGHEYHRYGGITRTVFRTRFDRDRFPVTTFEFSL
ncbi:hypothetical protein Hdeb2414_s0011g00367431 [Helianthus debilis subsp. tardiflorus]